MHTLQITSERRAFFEAQIAALRDRGIECTVVEVPGNYAADDPRGLTDYLRFYPRVLRAGLGSFDLVHAHYGLVTPFAFAQPTRPMVVTFWGSELMGDRAWLTRLSRASARFADRVVLPSEAMVPYLSRDAAHVPFPVDTETFRPIPRADARDYVGWTTDDPVVLFPYDPARPEKDFARAERVVERAATDAELRAVYDQPHSDVPFYMNAADIVLITSERESGPMTVREAMACNVPVVSTDVGFVSASLESVEPSVVADTDDDLAAGITRLLSRGERSDGRDSIDGLTPGAVAERLGNVYSSAIETSGAR